MDTTNGTVKLGNTVQDTFTNKVGIVVSIYNKMNTLSVKFDEDSNATMVTPSDIIILAKTTA